MSSEAVATRPNVDLARIRAWLPAYGVYVAIALLVLYNIAFTPNFLAWSNVRIQLIQVAPIVIVALGMALVIGTEGIDLSVGSVVGFIGALAAVLMVHYDWHFVPATLVCLLAGAAIGAAQGWFIAFFRIPSFIVTLAGMLVFKGLSLALLQGQSVGPFPASFQLLSSGFIPDWLSGETLRTTSLLAGIVVAFALIVAKLRERANQVRHAMESEPYPFFVVKNLVFVAIIVAFSWKLASYKGLPNVLIIMTLLMLFYDFVTTRTTVGRRIYALGGNEKAARLSGVKTQWLSFYTFVNMGVLAAVAGLVFAARLNTATPKARTGFELDVIAACFIGGASASGGVGKVLGAVIGAFVMGVMNNGMSILGIGIDYQQVIKGLVLLAAVFVDVYNKRKT